MVAMIHLTGMEMVAPKYRLLTGVVIQIFWSFGTSILLALAYLLRESTHLQLALTAPSVLFFSYYW